MNEALSDRSITPPVFALASDDPGLLAFVSVADAEGYAEPWDVNDGLWRFWDCTGRVLAPPSRIDERREWTTLVSTDRAEPEVLRHLLMRELASLGQNDEARSGMDLRALCELAAERINYRRPTRVRLLLKRLFGRGK
ncbi:MAG: hypothetical protein AAF480_08635 [Actinomycetota bacterium]